MRESDELKEIFRGHEIEVFEDDISESIVLSATQTSMLDGFD